LDAPIRVHHQPEVGRPHVADRDGHSELASARFGQGGVEQTLTEKREFELAHRALEPKQQAIVERARVVHPVGIDEQRFGQRAQIYQVMPIAVVARQPRGLQRKHRTGFSRTHARQQLQKARPLDQSATAASLILIDHNGLGKAQLARPIGEIVLTLSSLQMMAHLVRARLAHIHQRLAQQVPLANLVVHLRRSARP
jgi:hypothetical protein